MSALPDTADDAARAEALLEETAQEIRRHARASLLEFSFRVGEILLRRFYGGDREAARHRGTKDHSLRALAARLHDDVGLSAASLYRCVAVHDVLSQLADWASWRHIGPTHICAVLALPADRRRELLLRVERDRLSVRAVTALVPEIEEGRRLGRRAARRVFGLIERLERAAPDPQALRLHAAAILDLRCDEVEEAYRRLFVVREVLDRWAQQSSPKAVEEAWRRATGAPAERRRLRARAGLAPAGRAHEPRT